MMFSYSMYLQWIDGCSILYISQAQEETVTDTARRHILQKKMTAGHRHLCQKHCVLTLLSI